LLGRERLLEYGHCLVAGFNEVVIARYECKRHAFVQQKVRSFRAVSSIDMEVEKDSIEVELHKFLSRHSHVVRDARNPVTSLLKHFLNHLRNQGLVFDDKDARTLGGYWRGAIFDHAKFTHGALAA